MGHARGGEALKAVSRRLICELQAALKRKPPAEAKLAGALRAVAPLSAPVRKALTDAAEVLVRRKSFDRELYAASIRSVVDANDRKAGPLLAAALSCDDAGGLATLSAACFCNH